MKKDHPFPKYNGGENSWETVKYAGRGYPLKFDSLF